jgi:hypothetical protein
VFEVWFSLTRRMQSKLKAALARGGANADCTFQPSLPPKILARKDVRLIFCRFCVVDWSRDSLSVLSCVYCGLIFI